MNAESISYDEAKKLARDADPEVRKALAARDDVKAEILYFLADDPDAEVRRTLAANTSLPAKADVLLARDADEAVRAGLAEKISQVAPGLSEGDRGRIQDTAEEALSILARDQITRVRQVLSEALKDVAHAPAEVINRLARDSEAAVACPVLEFSPVLSEEDLLEIIRSNPASGGLSAIARRETVSENVSDAVAATDDVDAIGELLSNDNAQIREETLDNLIDAAPNHELWHAPLAVRPRLTSGAATRLARFLADNLLETMSQRDDLDSDTMKAVKEVVQHRLGDEMGRGADGGQSMDFLKMDPPLDMAKSLKSAGRLDEGVVSKALHAGDFSFVLASLVVMTDLPLDLVRKVFATQSAKGVVALVWKARMPAKLSVPMQQRMAGVAPEDVIGNPGQRDFPLNVDEMNWQLEFFADLRT